MSQIRELLGEKVINSEGKAIAVKHFCGEGTVIGLYFSAHWCPPCRMFTPALIKFYKKLRSRGEKLEIIFVSSDRDQEEFDEYIKEMPWLALPFGDQRADTLSEKFDVTGIPNFLLLDGKTGEVLTPLGRAQVTKDPEGENFPWRNTDES
ncbi:hypothetical protein SNE40_022789 [Patella caerulea]|uniref:Thioredoxin domain-containing protein n=1 Tax=Patella caerulea TaxID=87958 RepID=A0AAN8IW76_PATCE